MQHRIAIFTNSLFFHTIITEVTMKYRTATVLLCALLIAAIGGAQEKKPQPAAQNAGMDDMMKLMVKLATPGEQHKKLTDLVGTWDATTTMMMGPGAPPSTSKGTVVNTAVLGGRFLQMQLKADMMGMPMEGIGFLGYDNYNKKYTMFWIDNFGTVMSTAEGSVDKSGNVVAMYGKMDEPSTGEHGKNVKYVYRFVDKDRHELEIHDLSLDEPNTKVMTVVYTRHK
jgi:hypothetical protein